MRARAERLHVRPRGLRRRCRRRWHSNLPQCHLRSRRFYTRRTWPGAFDIRPGEKDPRSPRGNRYCHRPRAGPARRNVRRHRKASHGNSAHRFNQRWQENRGVASRGRRFQRAIRRRPHQSGHGACDHHRRRRLHGYRGNELRDSASRLGERNRRHDSRPRAHRLPH